MLPNTDFPVKEWRAAGLNVPSGVKAQVSTVEERLVVKIVGTLTASDRQNPPRTLAELAATLTCEHARLE